MPNFNLIIDEAQLDRLIVGLSFLPLLDESDLDLLAMLKSAKESNKDEPVHDLTA